MPISFAHIIASAALLISLFNSYHQFFRKVQKVKASMIGFDLSSRSSPEPAIQMDLGFVNHGNLPALIMEIKLLFRSPSSNKGPFMLKWDHFADGSKVSSLLLSPHDIVHRLVIFPYPKALVEQIEARFGPDIKLDVQFSVLTSEGIRCERELSGLGIKIRNSKITGGVAPAQITMQLLRPRRFWGFSRPR